MLKQAGQYIIPPGSSVGNGKDILIQSVQIAFQGREGEEFLIAYLTTEPDKNNTPIETGIKTSSFIFGKTGVIQYDNMGENRIYSIENPSSNKSRIIVDYVENVNMVGGGAGSEDENGSKENPYFNYYASVMVGGPNHVHEKEDETKGGVINE